MSGKFSAYISIFSVFPENMLCFDSGLDKYLLSLGNQAFSLNPEAVVLHAWCYRRIHHALCARTSGFRGNAWLPRLCN